MDLNSAPNMQDPLAVLIKGFLYSTSPPGENFLNLISHNYYPEITHPTWLIPISYALIDIIFSNRVDEIVNRSNNHKHI